LTQSQAATKAAGAAIISVSSSEPKPRAKLSRIGCAFCRGDILQRRADLSAQRGFGAISWC
jgi:hypothetical protein